MAAGDFVCGNERHAMSIVESQATPAKPKLRWFHLTPDRFVAMLLALEGGLLLSERLGWPA